jgi:hypothetical protein
VWSTFGSSESFVPTKRMITCNVLQSLLEGLENCLTASLDLKLVILHTSKNLVSCDGNSILGKIAAARQLQPERGPKASIPTLLGSFGPYCIGKNCMDR